MDKVKAIKVLKPLVDSYVDYANISMREEDDNIVEALEMAIEALKCSETPKSSEQNAETAQADHIADSGKKVCVDTISRQAALDTIMGQPPEPHYPSWYAAQIKKLPATQPEIVRCKDCKHYLHDEEYGFDWCNRMSGVFRAKPDGFCSFAERRTDE